MDRPTEPAVVQELRKWRHKGPNRGTNDEVMTYIDDLQKYIRDLEDKVRDKGLQSPKE